jgi:hypothetical protein
MVYEVYLIWRSLAGAGVTANSSRPGADTEKAFSQGGAFILYNYDGRL